MRRDRAAVTRTELPPGGTDVDPGNDSGVDVLMSPSPGRSSRASAEVHRVRRGLRRRAGLLRRRLRVVTRRLSAQAMHAWRSSLQVRIGAITMVVAGTVVVIVSLVLFSQIRDQLLSVKRQAAIDQAQNGVQTAQNELAGIAAGDAPSVRATLFRTVQQLKSSGGAAGDFDVAMVYRAGGPERPAGSRRQIYPALPDDLRAAVGSGSQSYKYAL